jgi:hypothetical protein
VFAPYADSDVKSVMTKRVSARISVKSYPLTRDVPGRAWIF